MPPAAFLLACVMKFSKAQSSHTAAESAEHVCGWSESPDCGPQSLIPPNLGLGRRVTMEGENPSGWEV